MDFIDEIRTLAARIPSQLEHLRTEEATKTALILPFINALGYNVFDPTEVVPEFTADFGAKKSDRVDYAIVKDGKPIMLFECKTAGTDINKEGASQLFQYFSATGVHFGVLTNGVVYRFHSDLENRNRMDPGPFFEFNMLEIDDVVVQELKRFTKSAFDLDSTLVAASELKYTREIKRILSHQLREPSDDFVKLFTSQIHPGRMRRSAKEQFTQLTKRALNQFINDRVYDRLKSAMTTEGEPPSVVAPGPRGVEAQGEAASAEAGTPIVTTEEERQGYYIIKAVLRDVIDVRRIAMRDLTSYCAVLLDDTNRKPICRLWFNAPQKYLGLLDEQRHEERIPIQDLDDIYQYTDRLKAAVSYYERPTSAARTEGDQAPPSGQNT
jgi:hypothetical protein